MDVDEARGDDQARGIDHLIGLETLQPVGDGVDPPGRDGNISAPFGSASSIQDAAVTNDEVGFHERNWILPLRGLRPCKKDLRDLN